MGKLPLIFKISITITNVLVKQNDFYKTYKMVFQKGLDRKKKERPYNPYQTKRKFGEQIRRKAAVSCKTKKPSLYLKADEKRV